MSLAELDRQQEELKLRRTTELEMCSRYATSEDDRYPIILELWMSHSLIVLNILRTHPWITRYVGDIENFIETGLRDACLATAIMQMYNYPDRHTFLVEYILDAAFAAIITSFGDDKNNAIGKGWDEKFKLTHAGFHYEISMVEISDEDPYF